VIGGPGYTAPSDVLNIAGIGVGGMGNRDVRAMTGQNIVALCDVDEDYAAKTIVQYPKARRYKDFRKMLETQEDIDAVIIATPDHLHAPISMFALNMGKHVYCEKPLTHTLAEVRKVTRAAREAGVATQMGNQGHASEEMRLLREWIADGAIGDVHEVHAWTTLPGWPQGVERPADNPPVPETMEWDLWLGPARYRPYHPCYHPDSWRGWIDFGNGGLGDMGCHLFDSIVWALHVGPPESVEASSSQFAPSREEWGKYKNLETYPRASLVTFRFPARDGFPPLKVTWYDGGLLPPRPEELEPDRQMGTPWGGALYVGTKGTIMTGTHGASGIRIIPEEKMQEYERPPKTLPRSIGHHQEWIQACKGGEPAGSHFDYGGPLTEIVLLGVIAIRMNQKLYWDTVNSRFTNSEEANQYLDKTYRKGWEV
jgi:predicted dehydrogenase